jgi:cytochrome c556
VARVLALVALIAGVTSASADSEKTPSIKEVMGKLNKGPDCIKSVLTKELKADQPNWQEIQKQTKEYVQGTVALEKATPKKGDKESWTKQTKAYHDGAVALDAAAQSKDKGATVAANSKLGTSCMSCHQQHRGR